MFVSLVEQWQWQQLQGCGCGRSLSQEEAASSSSWSRRRIEEGYRCSLLTKLRSSTLERRSITLELQTPYSWTEDGGGECSDRCEWISGSLSSLKYLSLTRALETYYRTVNTVGRSDTSGSKFSPLPLHFANLCYLLCRWTKTKLKLGWTTTTSLWPSCKNRSLQRSLLLLDYHPPGFSGLDDDLLRCRTKDRWNKQKTINNNIILKWTHPSSPAVISPPSSSSSSLSVRPSP